MAAEQGNEPNDLHSGDETASKEDFQSLREIIHEEGGDINNGDEDDDDETCGFCRFMKAGGCKKEFTAWSECVDTNRGEGHNFTEECRDATLDLQKCMEEHRDYYRDFMLDSEPGQGPDEGITIEPETGNADLPEKTGGKEEAGHSQDGKGPVEAAKDTAKDAAASVKDSAKDAAASAKDTAKDATDAAKDAAKDAAASAKDTAEDAASSAKDTAKGAAASAADAAQGAVEAVSDTMEESKGPVYAHAASADTGVDEPLPPTDRLLSGLEGEFQAKTDDDAQPEEEDSSAKEGGEAKEGEDSAEAGDESGQEEKAEDAGDETEEEEEEPKPVIELKTASHDPRFPSTNQARHCYTRYNEYHRCVAQKGEDDPECSVFQRAYRSICPSDWLERWNEARENGTWPGRY
ncbi:probable cytochrome c oxidase subunit 6B at C-terminar half [Coccomyxa sp. Obi]|nr:probable cytochrome c oxidase subunit 6B at C-terminar half [Coccomyxa sp. Obi]